MGVEGFEPPFLREELVLQTSAAKPYLASHPWGSYLVEKEKSIRQNLRRTQIGTDVFLALVREPRRDHLLDAVRRIIGNGGGSCTPRSLAYETRLKAVSPRYKFYAASLARFELATSSFVD